MVNASMLFQFWNGSGYVDYSPHEQDLLYRTYATTSRDTNIQLTREVELRNFKRVELGEAFEVNLRTYSTRHVRIAPPYSVAGHPLSPLITSLLPGSTAQSDILEPVRHSSSRQSSRSSSRSGSSAGSHSPHRASAGQGQQRSNDGATFGSLEAASSSASRSGNSLGDITDGISCRERSYANSTASSAAGRVAAAFGMLRGRAPGRRGEPLRGYDKGKADRGPGCFGRSTLQAKAKGCSSRSSSDSSRGNTNNNPATSHCRNSADGGGDSNDESNVSTSSSTSLRNINVTVRRSNRSNNKDHSFLCNNSSNNNSNNNNNNSSNAYSKRGGKAYARGQKLELVLCGSSSSSKYFDPAQPGGGGPPQYEISVDMLVGTEAWEPVPREIRHQILEAMACAPAPSRFNIRANGRTFYVIGVNRALRRLERGLDADRDLYWEEAGAGSAQPLRLTIRLLKDHRSLNSSRSVFKEGASMDDASSSNSNNYRNNGNNSHNHSSTAPWDDCADDLEWLQTERKSRERPAARRQRPAAFSTRWQLFSSSSSSGGGSETQQPRQLRASSSSSSSSEEAWPAYLAEAEAQRREERQQQDRQGAAEGRRGGGGGGGGGGAATNEAKETLAAAAAAAEARQRAEADHQQGQEEEEPPPPAGAPRKLRETLLFEWDLKSYLELQIKHSSRLLSFGRPKQLACRWQRLCQRDHVDVCRLFFNERWQAQHPNGSSARELMPSGRYLERSETETLECPDTPHTFGGAYRSWRGTFGETRACWIPLSWSLPRPMAGEIVLDESERRRMPGSQPRHMRKEHLAFGSSLSLPEVKAEVQGADPCCAICLSEYEEDSSLFALACGHIYHEDCLACWFLRRPRCPTCQTMFGTAYGQQPSVGRMKWRCEPFTLPGCDAQETIVVRFSFPPGVDENGREYVGRATKAYLPGTSEGILLLELFKVAFRRRVMYGLGESLTRGVYRPSFNIHLKTRRFGGATDHGFPDLTYVTRTLTELQENGIGIDCLT